MRICTHMTLALAGCILLQTGRVAALQDSSEFALNIFSDIAPIISLFGEEFAKQFLSQSMAWYDHIIFAMVPLGIVTIIIGVIRVSGPTIARAFIGRARENGSIAQLDLMSCISNEVCEMFNGSSIVRAMGSPTMGHFLVFPPETGDDKSYEQYESRIHTLKTAVKSSRIIKKAYMSTPSLSSGTEQVFSAVVSLWAKVMGFGHVSDVESQGGMPIGEWRPGNESTPTTRQEENHVGQTYDKRDDKGEVSDIPDTPNLLLNLTAEDLSRWGSPQLWEALIVVSLSILTQCGLIIIATVTVFHGPTRKSTGSDSEPYALPSYISGSLLLSLGVGLCSVVIERSTEEYSWHLRQTEPENHHTPLLLFLQPDQKVQDMEFRPYLIFAGLKKHLVTSRIPESEGSMRARQETLAVLGAIVTGSGFIVQYIGLRALPYPCAIAQLGAIFILAFIRAWFRRRIGAPPLNDHALPGHELDCLTFHMVLCGKCNHRQRDRASPTAGNHLDSDKLYRFMEGWQVMEPTWAKPTQLRGRPFDECWEPQTSRALVNVRKRLGNLCEWSSPSWETALCLRNSIQHFADAFMVSLKESELKWRLNLPSSTEKSEPNFVEVTISRSVKDRRWTIDVEEIEAILSLWVAQHQALHKERRNAALKGARVRGMYDYVQNLGPNEHGCLERDLTWWVEGLPRLQKDIDFSETEKWMPIGYIPESEDRLFISGRAPLLTIMARHLFVNFIWHFVDQVSTDCLRESDDEVDITNPHMFLLHSPQNTLHFPSFKHRKLSQAVQQIKKDGLGSATEVLMCIIPPFSSHDLLPNHKLFDFASKNALQLEWLEGTRFFHGLIGPHMKLRRKEQLEFVLVARVLDFIELVLEPHDAQSFAEVDSRLSKGIRDLLETLVGEFKEVLERVAPVLAVQGRAAGFESAFRIAGLDSSFGIALFARVAKESWSRQESDDLGKIMGHCAYLVSAFTQLATKGEPLIWDERGHPHERQKDMKLKDFVRGDIFGWTTAHYSVALVSSGLEEWTKSIPPEIKLEQLVNHMGRNFAHVATIAQNYQALESLGVSFTVETRRRLMKTPGSDGMTPLHLAAKRKTPDCAKFFVLDKDKDSHFVGRPEAWIGHETGPLDRWGRLHCHIAAKYYPEGIGSYIWLFENTRLDVEDQLRKTPLMYFFDSIDSIEGRQKISSETAKTIVNLAYRDEAGRTMWHLATQTGDGRLFPTLLQLKQDLMKIDFEIGRFRRTDPLPGYFSISWRVYMGWIKLKSELQEWVPTHPREDLPQEAWIRMPSPLPFNIEILARDNEQKSPLDYAIDSNNDTLARYILESFMSCLREGDNWCFGNSKNTLDDAGFATGNSKVQNNIIPRTTSLMRACDKGAGIIVHAILSLHLAAGRDETGLHPLNKDLLTWSVGSIAEKDRYGRTALRHALAPGSEHCAIQLLADNHEHGEAMENVAESLLITAVKRSTTEVAIRVLDRWPFLGDQADTKWGLTPLHWACDEEKSLDLVSHLIRHPGVDVRRMGALRNWNALHFAARRARVDHIEALLYPHGAIDFDERFELSDLAAEVNLKSGADPDARDSNDQTPLEVILLADFNPVRRAVRYETVQVLGTVTRPTAGILMALETTRQRGENLMPGYLDRFIPYAASELNDCIAKMPRTLRDQLATHARGYLEDPNAQRRFQLPYHVAAQLGDHELIIQLSNKGVPGDELDQDGWTWTDYWHVFASRWHGLQQAHELLDTLPGRIPDGCYQQPASFDLPDSVDGCVQVTYGHGFIEMEVVKAHPTWKAVRISSREPVEPTATYFYFEVEMLASSQNR